MSGFEIKRRDFLVRSGCWRRRRRAGRWVGCCRRRRHRRRCRRAGIGLSWRRGSRSAMCWGTARSRGAGVIGRRGCSWEWELDERFRRPRLVRGPHALEDSDFTARVDLWELGPEVKFQKAPPASNDSPLGGYQFFGEIQHRSLAALAARGADRHRRDHAIRDHARGAGVRLRPRRRQRRRSRAGG